MTRGPYRASGLLMAITPAVVPRMGRAVMGLISQETALTNAAEAGAKLRQRRLEREEVDAYLSAQHSPMADTT